MSTCPRALVVGLGSPDRGDDALGAEVAARVATTLPEGARATTRVVEHEDPTALIDLLERIPGDSRPEVLVAVDAIRGAGPPGTVLCLEVGPGGHDEAVLREDLDPGPAGTHGFGLAGAIELARVLGRLPPRVVVVGVVATQFEHGAPLSAPAAAAVPHAADVVLDVLGHTAHSDAGHSESLAASKRRCKSEAKPAPASA